MSEKRFERWNNYSYKVKDNQEDTFLNWEDVVNKLNELEARCYKLYVFTLRKLPVDDVMEEAENEDMEYVLEFAGESIYQFESGMKDFNQDKNGKKKN